jgi:hypothetical protein
MVVSKGGFSWYLLLTEEERYLNSQKNCQLFRDNLKHTQTIVIAEEIKTYYPTCSIIASSQ